MVVARPNGQSTTTADADSWGEALEAEAAGGGHDRRRLAIGLAANTITTSANGAYSVFAIDVDGDGDVDVLSASLQTYYDDKIAWYENTNGDGTSWTTRVITTAANGARSVFAIDVDGDGDVDVLSASGDDDKIAWYVKVPLLKILLILL